MAKIHTLPPLLANQIAAGEVIDRPASVIKELLENSIDANATEIKVDVVQGGAARICIQDNGEGIDKDDLPLALKRHATSKLMTTEDLHNIQTLGFRGEALASIASVAKCVLSSKPNEQEEAWSCSVKGHEQKPYLYPASLTQGTQLVIQDLFYNVPARRKFLKTTKTELNHIEQVIKKTALSYPKVALTLVHNDKTLVSYKVSSNWARRIEQVCGKKFVEHAYELEVIHDEYRFSGWLGNEHVFRKHADCQFFFINHRPVRDKIVQHAIKNAFFQMGFNLEQNFPSFVLFLECPPSEVDVNVHPTKHEVRFNDPSWVHDFIQKCVMETLKVNEDGSSSQQPIDPQQSIFSEGNSSPTSKASTYAKASADKSADKSGGQANPEHSSEKGINQSTSVKLNIENASNTKETEALTPFPDVSLELEVFKPAIKSNMTFWSHYGLLFKRQLWVINLKDQQACIWQKLMQEANNNPWPSRVCLFPHPVQSAPDKLNNMEAFGLKLRKNAVNKWHLTHVPAFFEAQDVALLTKTWSDHASLEPFFYALNWRVFLRHAFFSNRFESWCEQSFEGFQKIEPDCFQALLEPTTV